MLSCQQPSYLPWLGYFEQIRRAEKFIFLDSAQWTRQGTQHRTRLPSSPRSTEPQWLTIPVLGHGHRQKTLKDMQVDGATSWAKKHWQTIQSVYGKAPHFKDQLEPILRPFYEKIAQEKFLIEICQESTYLFWETLELQTEVFWSSELPETGAASARLISLCQAVGERDYYSALGSTPYMDLSLFREAGIRVRWQHFRPYLSLERPINFSVLDWFAFEPAEKIRARLTGPIILSNAIAAHLEPPTLN